MGKIEHITVVYFSLTGGTREACLNLAMEMGKKVKDMDPCSLEGEYPFGSEDIMIVDVPMLGGRIPGYIAKELTHLKGGEAMALTAAVYGNRAFEGTSLELDGCLKVQRLRIGARTVLLAEHLMVQDVAAGRPDNQNRKEMADLEARVFEELEEEGWQEPQVPGSRPYRDWKQMPVIPLTNASCISCGLCATRYPVQAIPISNPPFTDQACYVLYMRCISVYSVKTRSLPEQARAILEQKLSPVRDIRWESELFL